MDEVGIIDTIADDSMVTSFKPGQIIVRVDPRYFRPTEVQTLLGNPAKAKEQLGWTPTITFKELVSEMMRSDLDLAQKDELCKREGFTVLNHHE